MTTRHLLMLTSLLAAPFALAHVPDGTPKNYCEWPPEWEVHDYGPPADGRWVSAPVDGNVFGDCNGDTVPADYDGHREWAAGGAWLSARTWDDISPYGHWGAGSSVCLGEWAHHPQFPTVYVFDTLFGSGTPFRVSADHYDVLPLMWPTCGDGISETYIDCFGACTVPFPPGLDGTYHVCVFGTQGHVTTGGFWGGGSLPAGGQPLIGAGAYCGDPVGEVLDLIPPIDLPQCMDGADNDNDGSVDFKDDSHCNSPVDDTEQS